MDWHPTQGTPSPVPSEGLASRSVGIGAPPKKKNPALDTLQEDKWLVGWMDGSGVTQLMLVCDQGMDHVITSVLEENRCCLSQMSTMLPESPSSRQIQQQGV